MQKNRTQETAYRVHAPNRILDQHPPSVIRHPPSVIRLPSSVIRHPTSRSLITPRNYLISRSPSVIRNPSSAFRNPIDFSIVSKTHNHLISRSPSVIRYPISVIRPFALTHFRTSHLPTLRTRDTSQNHVRINAVFAFVFAAPWRMVPIWNLPGVVSWVFSGYCNG